MTAIADALGHREFGVTGVLTARALKRALQERTAAAIEAGVFGVPTFELDGELFWGHDRLDHLAARIDGRLPDLSAQASVLEGRPRGSDRPLAPILRELRRD